MPSWDGGADCGTTGCGCTRKEAKRTQASTRKTNPVIRYVDLRAHARNCLYQFRDAIHARVPLGVKFLGIRLKPGLDGREAADDLFLSNLHGPTHGAFERAGIMQSSFD